MTKINLYIFILSLKFIFINLLIITIIVLFINSIELSRIIIAENSNIKNFLYLSLIKIPTIILETITFVIIIGLSFLFRNLVTNNEFIALRNSGLSIIDIYKPVGMAIFSIGIFLLIIINPIAAKLEIKFNDLTSKNLDNLYSIKFIDNGLWMKNITTKGNKNYIIINEIDLDKMVAKDIKILVTGNGEDKMIISKKGQISNNSFKLQDLTILDIFKKSYTEIDNYNLKLNFENKNITDSLTNFKLIPFYNYWHHTNNLKKFNLYSDEVGLHYISELLKPIFMVIIGLVVLGFSGKYKRNESFFKILFISILIGFVIILTEEIVVALTIKLNISFIFSYMIIFILPFLVALYKIIKIEND